MISFDLHSKSSDSTNNINHYHLRPPMHYPYLIHNTNKTWSVDFCCHVLFCSYLLLLYCYLGVTFDTGGLNIKGMGMRGMKKDMAGAAQVHGLAPLFTHPFDRPFTQLLSHIIAHISSHISFHTFSKPRYRPSSLPPSNINL